MSQEVLSDLKIAEEVYACLMRRRLLRRMLTAKDRWAGVHPRLEAKVRIVMLDMESRSLPMMVTDGLRTTAEQRELYALGRTKPGRVVTNVDGVKKRSNHQAKADRYGHAVDLTFINKATGAPFWPSGGNWDRRWKVFGKLIEAQGLTWGGSWKTLIDRPHVELR